MNLHNHCGLTAAIVLLNLRFSIHLLYIDWG
jgi:hypothetical protein